MAVIRYLAFAAFVLLTSATSNRTTAKQWLHDDDARTERPFPWGGRTVQNSDPVRDAPNTGKTRYYDLHISRDTLAPDGVDREMIVINGQYPGPKLEANWGDWFEITVHNHIYDSQEGTAIHWHGINQHGTPWYDGAATESQCPIAPGESLTYRFRAEAYGTTWYHAHYSAQVTAGIAGPMVIYGPSHVTYDEEIEPIMVSDWYHKPYQELVLQAVRQNVVDDLSTRPASVSNLVAGLGVFPCDKLDVHAECTGGEYASFDFEPGTTYRMRFINSGAIGFEQISIDEHNMTVIAYDLTPIEPYETNTITLAVGQRADVLVTATGSVNSSYWLRAWNQPRCGDSNGPDGRAIILYPDANDKIHPSSTAHPPPENLYCKNDALSLTRPARKVAVIEPSLTLHVNLTYHHNASNSALWWLNGIPFKGNLNDPLLLKAISSNSLTPTFPPERSVYNLGNNTSIRLVFENNFRAPHPMHLHGHDFQVLAEGFGTWDGAIVNPENPMRRDTQNGWGGAGTDGNPRTQFIVIQWNLDNPGMWMFHCHISWHLSAGMALNFLENPGQLINMKVPGGITDGCKSWNDWTSDHVVDVIDAARVKEKRSTHG